MTSTIITTSGDQLECIAQLKLRGEHIDMQDNTTIKARLDGQPPPYAVTPMKPMGADFSVYPGGSITGSLCSQFPIAVASTLKMSSLSLDFQNAHTPAALKISEDATLSQANTLNLTLNPPAPGLGKR